MAGMRTSSAERPRTKAPSMPVATRGALTIFALIVASGPLLFGAVDQWAQVILVSLLAVGVMFLPPAIVPLSKWGNRLLLALVALLVIKELAPAEWFGTTLWRKAVTNDFGIELPPTHHPEPARVLDGWLAAAIGAVWFLWVRRLAADRENRPVLAWSLFGAAALVAVVSFATRGWDAHAIYGLRPTLGWRGFGPFPNRNHTADLLAMGAVLGCGCITWAAVRKKWGALFGGVLAFILVVVALLTTESRGGLVAFGMGLAVYLVLVQLRLRNRRALAVGLAVAFVVGALGLAFGGGVLARFQSEQAGAVSNSMRMTIWRDVMVMWKDAPLLGHGVNSFGQIFPFYQTFDLENGVVLHPESSWRLWLVELGLLPVVLAAIALVLFMADHLREAFQGRNFFFRAAGFAAALALLGHAIFDVPAHRWGTAGFALAALALACPMRLGKERIFASRKTALVPVFAAVFWVWPYFFGTPAWSPLTLQQALATHRQGQHVSTEQWHTLVRYFPLSYDLNQVLGMRELVMYGREKPSIWQRHFAIASELLPGSWRLPAAQAHAVAQVSPALSLSYWQQAVERGVAHRGDVFRMAVQETAQISMATASWGRYAEAHPELLLTYAQLFPDEQARPYFELWWKERARHSDLTDAEIATFYQNASRWATREQFVEWMRHHSGWQIRDHREWARLLLGWGDAEGAWKLLAVSTPEEGFPALPADLQRAVLEAKWNVAPTNFVNAQQLAGMLAKAGEVGPSEEIVLKVGTRDDAPWWFVQKAAYIQARRTRYAEAAALLLRMTPPRP
jgi:O-antigen ligase